jgi:hypothetical protein
MAVIRNRLVGGKNRYTGARHSGLAELSRQQGCNLERVDRAPGIRLGGVASILGRMSNA